MPKSLHYLFALLILVQMACQSKRETGFEPWQLLNSETTHILAFNNTSIGFQNLKQQQKVSGIFSLPKLPQVLDSLSAELSEEGNAYLFIHHANTAGVTPEDSVDFTWVSKVNDSLRAEQTQSLIYGADTVFVFSKGDYRLYSSRKYLPSSIDNPQTGTVHKLTAMFELKKDKPLVVGKKLNDDLGIITVNDEAWAVYEPQVITSGQSAHGVVITNKLDSIKAQNQSLTLDLEQQASVLSSPEVIPLSAQNSISLVLNRPQSLTQKLKVMDSLFVLNPFIETIEEASLIEFKSGQAWAIRSLDMNLSLGTLTQNWTNDDNFRGLALKSFDYKDIQIQPLEQIFNQTQEMTHAFVWEDFIILTSSRALAEEYIAQLQNKNTLARSDAWQSTQEDLARESSVLAWTSDGDNKSIQTLQLIEDSGFLHLNYALVSGGQKVNQESTGPLLRSIKLNAPLAQAPQFFSNHRSGGKNIVVQDINNRLYFIAPNGKTLWYRDLKEPIIGPIQEVDLLRNGKKQLAFVTAKKWYIIDRNGRDVGPFPKTFKDPISQPLAIFDYDNNRKYRFVVIQDRSVLMYDAQGKRVRGFTYNKAPATVSHPPTHIRINNKDYLLFLLKNGQLQILSRTGKVRIPVSEQFNFSADVPVKHEGKIVFWTEDGSQILISENGAVVKLTAKSPAQYRVVYYGAHTVEFDDPLLRIDQHLIELPLGNYLGPQVFKFGNKLRSVMVDKDSQNIYIYNSEGRLLKNLPFFGSSKVDIADLNNNGKLELVVQGQADELLIYRLD